MTDKTHNIDTSDLPIHRYVTMLHLVSKKHSNFIEIRDLLCIKMERGFPFAYISNQILGGIISIIENLNEEWKDDIPIITAFVFDRNNQFTRFICGKVFGNKNKQPDQEQVEAYAERINTYSNWDNVLEVFRNIAFCENKLDD